MVFDGPEDYHHRIDDPALDIDERTILIMRGAGPIGYPGGAEVVNMQPPAALIRQRRACAAVHRRRAAVGHLGLALDPQRLARGGRGRRARAAADRRPGPHRPNRRTADILLPDEELARRRTDLAARGGYPYPASQTPWQEIQRGMVDQLAQGMVLKPAVKYRAVAQTFGVPRDNH